MRLFILGVSALSLSACSMGGVGFGPGHAGYESSPSVGYGSWQSGHSGASSQADAFGYGANQSQHQGHSYAATSYAPSPCQPAYQPSPCAAAQPQAVNYTAQYMPPQVTQYPSGYPSTPMPAPTQYAPPPAVPCGVNPCASSYSVSPYGHDASYGAQDYGYQSTGYTQQSQSPYSYGTQGGSYGYGYQPITPSLRGPRQSHVYGSLGVGFNRLVDTSVDSNDGFGTSIVGRLGVSSGSWYGAEAEVTKGISKSEIIAGTEAGVDYQVAAFGVARLPITRSKRARLLARAGYHTTKLETEVGGVSTKTDENGLALGIGFEYDMTPRSTIRLDSTGYALTDDTALGAATVSYQMRF